MHTMALRGFQPFLPPKRFRFWGPSASPVSALSAKGQHVLLKAHVLCCGGLSSCSSDLSFVSCLHK